VNGGQTILNAAWGSGQQVTRSPVLKRNHPVQGVPAELNQLIFTLKPGQATMVESNVGFLVARLAQVVKADPKSDPSGLADVRQSLTHALADDYLVSFATAVREEAKPVVNSKVLDQMIQTPGE
jgi:peptidyl-prolyl cis-trans isomerase D